MTFSENDRSSFRVVNLGWCMAAGCTREAFFFCLDHQLGAARFDLLAVLRARSMSPHCKGCGAPLKNNGRREMLGGRLVRQMEVGHPLPLCAWWRLEMRS